MLGRAWEYVEVVFRFYKTHISGWMFGIAAIVLGILAAFVSDDPSMSASIVRWSARITGSLALLLVFSAQYDAWREEKTTRELLGKRLEPRIEIANLSSRVWPEGQGGIPVTGKEYFFDILNNSESESLENVRVEVFKMIPDVIGYPYPPLHVRNDDYQTREFSVNPSSARQIDLVTGPVAHSGPFERVQKDLVIAHTVNDYRTPISPGRYELTVKVSARNAPPTQQTFVIWVDDARELQCVIKSSATVEHF